jgi:peptidoglycan/LPS O-acetylase OafA/YrhL
VSSSIRSHGSLDYIPGLDGLRAIAVAMVVVWHYSATFFAPLRGLGGFWDAYTRVVGPGWSGVDLFFVISGYLICTLLQRARHLDWRDYGVFLVRRALRLLPAYYFCVACVVVLAWILGNDEKILGHQGWLWLLGSNVAGSFVERNPFSDRNFAVGHFWSLAVEWHFYLLLPLLFMASASRPRICLILIAGAFLTRLSFVVAGLPGYAVYGFSPCRIDSLAIGCLVAVVDRSPLRGREPMFALAGAAVLLAVFAALAAEPSSVDPVAFKALGWVQLAGYPLVAAGFAGIVLWILALPAGHPVLRALESGVARGIGRASYSIYLWHLVFTPTLIAFARTVDPDPRIQMLVVFGSGLTLTACAASLSYWALEVHVGRWRTKLGPVAHPRNLEAASVRELPGPGRFDAQVPARGRADHPDPA